MTPWALLLALSAACLLAPARGWSQEPRPAHPFGLSEFEWRITQRAMAQHDLKPLESFEAAQGRTIESIHVFTQDPLTEEDPWPLWGNLFHVTSQAYVIQRELLFAEGDSYDSSLVQESARNLRNQGAGVLLLALVLPMEGSAPDKVRILVVSRDIWSLRTNTNFQVVGGVVNFAALSLSENNILGRHKQGAITSLWEQDTLRVGEYYADPRLLGSRVALSESAAAIFNHDNGDFEGYSVGVGVSKPLFSLRTPWGWSMSASGVRLIERRFQGSDVLQLSNEETGEQVPFVYRYQSWGAGVSNTTSLGVRHKSNFTTGYSLANSRYQFGESDQQAAQFTAQTRQAFERSLLPRSEQVSQVYFSYSYFEADYEQLRNFETFALPEDFRFGPSASLTLGHADPLLGSDARFASLGASATWRWRLHLGQRLDREGDVFSVGSEYGARLQAGELLDNQWTLNLRNYSPVFWGGRVVWRGFLLQRWQDRSNRISSLGGDAGLRGYEIGQFQARSYARSNLEWRSLPIELWTFHLGMVLFYDAVGFDSQGRDVSRELRHSVGLGGRWLNPASNRIVLRFDWGFPLGAPEGSLPGSFAFGFEQAF